MQIFVQNFLNLKIQFLIYLKNKITAAPNLCPINSHFLILFRTQSMPLHATQQHQKEKKNPLSVSCISTLPNSPDFSGKRSPILSVLANASAPPWI
jgi:hypothetical protein